MLIGPAGTGKTTLLRMLCSGPGLAEKGLLLLAPTGKARVRLEEQTGMRGAGQTLAQFLIRQQRYDGETGAYFPKPRAPRCGDYRAVIVDECSMLTEEQLAALIDSLSNSPSANSPRSKEPAPPRPTVPARRFGQVALGRESRASISLPGRFVSFRRFR